MFLYGYAILKRSLRSTDPSDASRVSSSTKMHNSLLHTGKHCAQKCKNYTKQEMRDIAVKDSNLMKYEGVRLFLNIAATL